MAQPTILRLLASFLAAAAVVASTRGAPAAEALKVTISYAEKTIDNLPLVVANDAGYFKQHGLDASLRYLPAQEGVPALLTGQVQIASLGGSDAVSAEAQKAMLELVTTLSPIYAFQFWTRPQFADARALRGQRIGVASATGTLYSATLLALRKLGLGSSDVQLTSLGSVTNVNAALMAGSVVAAASHPPATYEFQRNGLVDLVDLAKQRIPSASAGIFVTKSYMDAHREVVQDVVDAVVEAIRREKSDRTFTESEMGKFLSVRNKGELDFTYDFYAGEVLAAGSMPSAAEIQSNIKALSSSDPAVKSIDATAMVDQSFVKRAEK